MEKNVQLKYRLYRRRNGNFYWQENGSKKQGTFTTDRHEAERLLNAMNESHREPTLNLNLARAYHSSKALSVAPIVNLAGSLNGPSFLRR
jgi:leucyl aminopeptidase